MVELELEYRIVLVHQQRQPVDNAVMLVGIVAVVVTVHLVDDIAVVDVLERIEHERLVEFLSFYSMMVCQQIAADEPAVIVVVRHHRRQKLI